MFLSYKNAETEKEYFAFVEDYQFLEMCLETVLEVGYKTCFLFNFPFLNFQKDICKKKKIIFGSKSPWMFFLYYPNAIKCVWCIIPGNNEFSPDEDPHVVADCIKVHHLITNDHIFLHLHFHLGVYT